MARTVAVDYTDKREAILRAAARLFADEGYGRASMAGVALACGISKANIYHYYPSKKALLFDMLDSHLRMLRDRICGLTFETDDPKDRLRTLFVEVLLAYEGADAEHDVLISATQALSPEHQEILKQYQREFIRVGRDLVAGICPPEIAQDQAKLWTITMSLFGMLNWHYKWSSSANAETRRDHANLMADLVISGLPNLQG
ncbi:MAG: TetR/AcrR family transcriptional regulator [Rhizobiales bacterium]|nr:TetR/AcrR family transcriptional regulator [Hyphomicrobiales bacterium]